MSTGRRVERGYVLLARAIEQSAIWRDPPDVLKLFIYLLLRARYKAEPKRFDGFEEKRGELVTSLADIAKDNAYRDRGLRQWSRQKVGRMLARLQRQGRIVRFADTYGTHIKICNYELYQDPKAYEADECVTSALRVCDGCGTDVETPKEREEGQESQEEKGVRGRRRNERTRTENNQTQRRQYRRDLDGQSEYGTTVQA